MRSIASMCLAIVLAAAARAPAEGARRQILVVNAGNEAVFSLRVGHAASSAWSGDLLGYAQVIDVSSGRDVAVDVAPGACAYDVEATYGDGHQEVIPNVDLCCADRLEFDH